MGGTGGSRWQGGEFIKEGDVVGGRGEEQEKGEERRKGTRGKRVEDYRKRRIRGGREENLGRRARGGGEWKDE